MADAIQFGGGPCQQRAFEQRGDFELYASLGAIGLGIRFAHNMQFIANRNRDVINAAVIADGARRRAIEHQPRADRFFVFGHISQDGQNRSA